MFRSDPAASHRASWKLLPWYVNGTLEPVERASVEQHLEACAACRTEIASLGELSRNVRQQPSETQNLTGAMAVDRGLRQVLDRIDSDSTSRFSRSPAVRWVLAAQAAVILALISLLAWPSEPAEPGTFHVLSDRPAGHGPEARGQKMLRIVFEAQTTEGELRRLLASIDAQIIAGPSQVGAYTLSIPQASASDAALAKLRAEARVKFVEPVRAR